jgi:hypothetical protein
MTREEIFLTVGVPNSDICYDYGSGRLSNVVTEGRPPMEVLSRLAGWPKEPSGGCNLLLALAAPSGDRSELRSHMSPSTDRRQTCLCLGPPCSWRKRILESALPGWESLKFRTREFGHECRGTAHNCLEVISRRRKRIGHGSQMGA